MIYYYIYFSEREIFVIVRIINFIISKMFGEINVQTKVSRRLEEKMIVSKTASAWTENKQYRVIIME